MLSVTVMNIKKIVLFNRINDFYFRKLSLDMMYTVYNITRIGSERGYVVSKNEYNYV